MMSCDTCHIISSLQLTSVLAQRLQFVLDLNTSRYTHVFALIRWSTSTLAEKHRATSCETPPVRYEQMKRQPPSIRGIAQGPCT